MLYDKRWEKKVAGDEGVSPEIFSLDGLIAWLEKQNQDAEYCWDAFQTCLIGKYLSDHGLEFGQNYFDHSIPYKICGGDISYRMITKEHPHTFEAALSRARKIAEAR